MWRNFLLFLLFFSLQVSNEQDHSTLTSVAHRRMVPHLSCTAEILFKEITVTWLTCKRH